MQCEDAGIVVDLRNQPTDKRKDAFKEHVTKGNTVNSYTWPKQ
jgi:hypothetical protein